MRLPPYAHVQVQHKLLLNARLQKRWEELLLQMVDSNDCLVHELRLAPDHIHLFLGIGPGQSVSDANCLLKCNMARALFEEHPALRKRFWSGARGSTITFTGQLER